MHSESEAIQVEIATAKNFLNWFNRRQNRNLKIVQKQERPDFLCADDHGEFGIEVTLAYHDQSDAKSIWRVVRGEVDRELGQVISLPEELLTNFINDRIESKIAKGYGKRTMLVVRVPFAPFTEPWEIENKILPNLLVPSNNDFEAIFVTFDQSTYFQVA